MDSAQNQLVEKLNSAANVLVTVSRNPSVDQLSACVGLTLLLNKLGKHATAVFSGEVPSTMEFLDPESTLEKNTDSLRDFIIALDKSKADKLRYKVEDEMVRIFITPYRTSISQNDLEFSQGDFNVDVVVALGVQRQEDLDEAITSHGRILHDAVVSSVNTKAGESLGSINWTDSLASSLSELVYDLASALNKELIDGQIATALLTGIVAETARFSNEKTTPQTMSVSAALMAAGANQQLVASKLAEPSSPAAALPPAAKIGNEAESSDATSAEPKSEPGTLEIEHEAQTDEAEPADGASELSDDNDSQKSESNKPEPVLTDELSSLIGEVRPSDPVDPVEPVDSPPPSEEPVVSKAPRLVVDPPTLGGTLTANSRPEYEMNDVSSDPLSLPSVSSSLLSRSSSDDATTTDETVPLPPEPEKDDALQPEPTPEPPAELTPPPATWAPPADDVSTSTPSQADAFAEPGPSLAPAPLPPVIPSPSDTPTTEEAETGDTKTLADIEQAVHSPHVATELNSARDEVLKALSDTPAVIEPIEALNAQQLGDSLHEPNNLDQLAAPSSSFTDTLQQVIPAIPGATTDASLPPDGFGDIKVAPPQTDQPSGSAVTDPTAPPPVPPPIPFNFATPPPPKQ